MRWFKVALAAYIALVAAVAPKVIDPCADTYCKFQGSDAGDNSYSLAIIQPSYFSSAFCYPLLRHLNEV
jgi:hypothetical protein